MRFLTSDERSRNLRRFSHLINLRKFEVESSGGQLERMEFTMRPKAD